MANPTQLYKIAGEVSEPLIKRVQGAMDWLFSSKAQNIGTELAEDAQKLHGKPLAINVTEAGETKYYPSTHTIRVNPNQIDNSFVSAPDGSLHRMTLERSLAHEMKHATQPGLNDDVLSAVNEVKEKAQSDATASLFNSEQLDAAAGKLYKAQNAQHRQVAEHIVGEYVDEFALPINLKVRQILADSPEFTKYRVEYELPALKVENRVAELQGGPGRVDYLDTDPRMLRETLVNTVSHERGIHLKPDLPPHLAEELGAVSAGARQSFSPAKPAADAQDFLGGGSAQADLWESVPLPTPPKPSGPAGRGGPSH